MQGVACGRTVVRVPVVQPVACYLCVVGPLFRRLRAVRWSSSTARRVRVWAGMPFQRSTAALSGRILAGVRDAAAGSLYDMAGGCGIL